ncbi:MAG: ABC transporter permease [bacterium]|nr:ABC transporter permease [bacterium]
MFYQNNTIRETLAIARKEIQIDLRFAISYIFQSIVSPLGRLIPILTVYVATVGQNAISPIPGLTKETYIPFLALGIIFHTTWRASTSVFKDKFQRDKWSRTVELLFITPVKTSAIIVGFGISEIVKNTPTFFAFLLALWVIYPTTFAGFLLAFLMFILVTLIGLCVGLIFGGASLATENITPFLSYIISAFTFLTPFFYPIEVIDKLPHPLNILLDPLIRYNPLNTALSFARTAWLGTGRVSFFDILYVSIVALVLIFMAGYSFRFIWRKFGIQGS